MSKRMPTHIDPSELQRQRDIAEEIRRTDPGRKGYHIVTYGCQMNERDSQTLSGWLEAMGYCRVEEPREADVLLFNTCCVRDNAEKRVYGNVGALKAWKREHPHRILGVCGCMMQQEGAAQQLVDTFPFVDIAFGTHNVHELPEMLQSALAEEPVIAVRRGDGVIVERQPARRAQGPTAFLTIMYGCDNFCTYCIVPHVRGRERSRTVAEILEEARELRELGVREITLLGQNVNSYGRDTGGEGFPALLRRMDGAGFDRVRFMTSHPKDASDELFDVMASCAHIAPHLHLPVQSGSDAILSAMNRRYTRERYIERVRAAREAIPGLGLSTDFIVGFPGETDRDFEDTIALVNEVGFDAAYTFIYSPRRGTRAADMPDRVPSQVAKERIARLIDAQAAHTSRGLADEVGSRRTVLVEGMASRDDEVAGRTPRGWMVNLPGAAGDIGTLVDVDIVEARRNTLRGRRVDDRPV